MRLVWSVVVLEKGLIVFEFFFGPKNPTRNWQRAGDLRLEFDLEQGSLNGVRLGETLDRLASLGPVEDRSGLQHRAFGYFSLGLGVGCESDENLIESFDIIQKDPLAPEFRPYPGSVHYRGTSLDLAKLTESDFVKEFGLPYWRDQDESEIILFYEFPWREWQVELRLDGTFNRLLVTSAPSMADYEQRKSYGVTKLWPPNA